jgi:hypothetical protein
MRKWCRQATAALAAGLLAGCASAASPAAAPAAGTTTPKPVPYNLYTHCGIDHAQAGDQYYEATPPLSDGSGNPPPGWGNPYQPGTMTVISATQAVFTDKASHRVVFTLVPSGPGRTTAPVCS